MIVISDTSPITALLQIGQADLLRKLFREILIPGSVRAELTKSHSLLVLAKEQHADLLLMDELNGRRVAEREGLRFIGLMGVLVQAKRKNLVKSVRDDFRLSEEIKSIAFRNAGEP